MLVWLANALELVYFAQSYLQDGAVALKFLKPTYSFGKWWKLKFSLMGFVYRVVWVLKALWIFLSETILFFLLHKTNIFGMPPKILP